MGAMRSDMDKVLVERPRVGGWSVRKGRPPRDLEELPAFTGLRRQVKERGDFKDLNENLQPLRRYLERQLGRPWNKVYSEMRAHIDPGNEVQAHVLTHVGDFVRLRVEKVDAQAFVADHRISPGRFVGVVAAVSAVVALLGGWAASTAHVDGGPALGGGAGVATAAIGGVVLFCGLLATAGPLWWLLWRLRWRGWAASLLAGALLVCGVEGAYAAVLMAIGARFVAGAVWLVPLYSAPLGFGLGWVLWRVAVRPAPGPDAAFE